MGPTLALLVHTLSPGAWAAEPLTFGPDRPGIGDSTSTPGRGHALVEGGLITPIAAGSGVGLFASDILGRLGVANAVELRVRLPDLRTIGLGAKVAGPLGEAWSASVVPEVVLTRAGEFGGSLGGNLAFAHGALGVWGHGQTTLFGGTLQGLAGGGVSAGHGSVGAYGHAGMTSSGTGFVGIGGQLLATATVQLDLGMDVWLNSPLVWVPGVGIAFGF